MFFWPILHRQIRIEGDVSLISSQQADDYFFQRPRKKQLSAWITKQSHPYNDPIELTTLVNNIDQCFSEEPMVRPPFWIGYQILFNKIEF